MISQWLIEKARLFGGIDDLTLVEVNPAWFPFLIKELAKERIQVQIQDCQGWQHVPVGSPFQIEIPMDDRAMIDFDAYVLEFFPTIEAAQAYALDHDLNLSGEIIRTPKETNP